MRYPSYARKKATVLTLLTILDFLDSLYIFGSDYLLFGFVQAKAVWAVLNKGSLWWCGGGATSIDSGDKDKEGSKLDLHD